MTNTPHGPPCHQVFVNQQRDGEVAGAILHRGSVHALPLLVVRFDHRVLEHHHMLDDGGSLSDGQVRCHWLVVLRLVVRELLVEVAEGP